MCRISALVRKNPNIGQIYVADMMIDVLADLSEKQHRDGFGIFIGGQIYKQSLPLDIIMNNKDLVEFLMHNNNGFGPILCHVRQATVGKGYARDDSMAHPFTLGNYTLVHNGHFQNSGQVKLKFNIPANIVVDSEIFLHVLKIKSQDKPLTAVAIQDTVNEFIGPFVIFVHENIKGKEDGFWILMGKDRTMFLYETPDYYLFCTDGGVKDIVNRNLARNAVLTQTEYKPIESVFRLKQDMIYRIETGGLYNYGELKSIAEEKVVPKAPNVCLPTPTTASTNAEVVDLTSLCMRVSSRMVLLDEFNISDGDLDSLLNYLSPMFPSDGYDLSVDDIALLSDFLIHLKEDKDFPFNPDLNDEKYQIWSEICMFDSNPDISCAVLHDHFNPPYFMNPIEVLKECKDLIVKDGGQNGK